MNLTLLDINKNMCEAWSKDFKETKNIKIVNQEIGAYASKLYKENKTFAIVSPANSYGLMDGSYDYYITEFYKSIGVSIIRVVQEELYENYLGEQPVATVHEVKFHNKYIPTLLHIPTMRYPMYIQNTNIPYMCMKELLLRCNLEKFDEVIIPAFGGGVGKIPFEIISYQMKLAYDRVTNKERLNLINWNLIRDEIILQNK